jgi:benzoylformate decarboxylase
LVHIDESVWELGKNYPLEAAVWGHPKPALAELHAMLAAAMGESDQESARHRAARHAGAIAQARAQLRQQAASEAQQRPITSLCLMETLARILPPDVAIVEETPVSTRQYLSRVGALPNTSGYFAQRGWSLGWGLNCAIGVRLAWRQRPVLALIGDGAALYGIQGLWTAAHYRIPVCFLICNNAQYRILKNCARVLKLPQAAAGRFVGLDITDPQIDYVALARSFGVAGLRISEPDVLADAVAHFLRGDEPVLIDVPISNPD